MKLKSAAFLAALLVTAAGAKTPRRQPSQVHPNTIAIVVTYGDKTSSFLVTKEPTATKIEFAATGETPRTRMGAPKDWTFINARIDQLPGPSNDPQLCPRSNVAISRGNRQIFGCLRAPNPLSIQMRKLINLLALYL